MKKVIHIERLILRCDACGYEKKPVKLSRDWIGVPCPQCGANLLTRGDYEAAERLAKLADVANRLLGPWFGTENARGGELMKVNPREHKTTIWHGEDK